MIESEIFLVDSDLLFQGTKNKYDVCHMVVTGAVTDSAFDYLVLTIHVLQAALAPPTGMAVPPPSPTAAATARDAPL